MHTHTHTRTCTHTHTPPHPLPPPIGGVAARAASRECVRRGAGSAWPPLPHARRPRRARRVPRCARRLTPRCLRLLCCRRTAPPAADRVPRRAVLREGHGGRHPVPAWGRRGGLPRRHGAKKGRDVRGWPRARFGVCGPAARALHYSRRLAGTPARTCPRLPARWRDCLPPAWIIFSSRSLAAGMCASGWLRWTTRSSPPTSKQQRCADRNTHTRAHTNTTQQRTFPSSVVSREERCLGTPPPAGSPVPVHVPSRAAMCAANQLTAEARPLPPAPR